MDGIHVQVRLGEDPKVCLLIVIGVREDGVKELLAVEDGYRESTDSWAAVLRDLRDRGLNCPKLVTGDGALGAWAALRDVFPDAAEQRCWVHYVERRIMWMSGWDGLFWGASACLGLHNQRASRKASSLSVGW